MDDSHNGLWSGYIYYLPPHINQITYDLTKPLKLNLDNQGISIENVGYKIDPLKLKLDCDFETNLPCGISTFVNLHGQEFKNFEASATAFLTKI